MVRLAIQLRTDRTLFSSYAMGKAGSFVSSPYGLHGMLAVGKAGQGRSPGPPAGSGGTHECAGLQGAPKRAPLAAWAAVGVGRSKRPRRRRQPRDDG